MSDSIKPIEPNKLGMALARAIRSGRDILNSPGKVFDIGLGDLLMGQSPEAIEDYSHGFGPFSKGKGLTTRVDPRLVDIAGLPVPYAAAGVLGQKALAKAIRKGAEPAADETRRKLVLGTGAAAASAAIPDIAKITPSAVQAVAPDVIRTAAVAAPKTVAEFLPLFKDQLVKWSTPENWDKFHNQLGRGPFSEDEAIDWTKALIKWKDDPDLPAVMERALQGINPADVSPDFASTVNTQMSKSIMGMRDNLIPHEQMKLADQARLQLIDPNNAALREDYAQYLITGKLKPGQEGFKHIDPMDVQIESVDWRLKDLLNLVNKHVGPYYE